jgi:hypothetical protein
MLKGSHNSYYLVMINPINIKFVMKVIYNHSVTYLKKHFYPLRRNNVYEIGAVHTIQMYVIYKNV